MFSFYTLGVMSGAAEEVATGAEVTKNTADSKKYHLQILYFLLAVIYSYFPKKCLWILDERIKHICKKNKTCASHERFLIICTLHVLFILVNELGTA